jgi:hypothetical protein
MAEGVPRRDDHDHRALIDGQAAEAAFSRRLEQEPDVGVFEQRAPASRVSRGSPFQAHVGLLEAEDVKERTPARMRHPDGEEDRDLRFAGNLHRRGRRSRQRRVALT